MDICCRHDPQLLTKTEIINVCPGCNKRFGNDYQDATTISLLVILAKYDFFSFPDYHGESTSIQDACPTRGEENIHNAIRALLQKMNITLIEPKNTRTKSTCCGASFHGEISTDKVIEQMKKREDEMPVENVGVYCIACIKSIYNGGKKPRYLIDLLFNI